MTSIQSSAQAKAIKFIILDVDGVCTDGRLFYDCNGNVSKSFHVLDGIGVLTAFKLGVGVGIITGRNDALVEARIKTLGITDYYPGCLSKLHALNEIIAKHNLSLDEIAYVGDDWIDLDPMLKVGYPIAVQNARPEVKAIAKYITELKGGEGAVREAIEHIFSLQGKTGEELSKLWLESSTKAQ